jgi:hypothetical protein
MHLERRALRSGLAAPGCQHEAAEPAVSFLAIIVELIALAPPNEASIETLEKRLNPKY